jgi:hypothetical protein
MGEILELKILPHQFVFGGFDHLLPFGNQRFENISILSQRMINPPYKIGGVRVFLIIEGISTRIVTEFLVDSPPHWSVAVETVFLDWYHF